MRAAAAVIFLGLLVNPVVTATGAGAREQSAPPSGPVARPADEGAEGLAGQWHRRHQGRMDGNVMLAGEAESGLRERRRRDAVSRSESVAGALVLEAYESLELQHYPEAIASFTLAVEFDPEMPTAHIGLARVHWESNNALDALAALTQAVRAGWSNWVIRRITLHRLAWAVFWGIPLAAAGFFTLLFLKTFPLIQHRLQESLDTKLPPATASTLAILLPWLPLALPWGVAWVPLVWLVLAGPYLRRRERVVSMVLLVLAAVGGLAGLPATQMTARGLDPRILHVAEAARGGIGPERERTLAELIERAPGDATLQLLHADHLRGMGKHADALLAYRRAIELDPTLHPAHNNMGTLYFSLGEYGTAVRWFRQAINLDPQAMAGHYNLYLTQEHLFDFSAAESTLAAAQLIDLTQMTQLLSERDQRQGRLDVLQARVAVPVALEHARAALGQVAASAYPGVVAGWPFAVLPALVLTLLFRQRPSGQRPMRCSSCGRVACRRCALNLDRDSTCASCLALARRSTSLPRRTREMKTREIAAHHRGQTIIAWVLALLVPGGRQIWRDQTVIGALLLVIAGCVAGHYLTRSLVPLPIYQPVPPSAALTLLPGLTLLMLAWFTGLAWPGNCEVARPPMTRRA